MSSWRWAFAALAAVALAIAIGGCSAPSSPVALRTAAAPAQACMDALIGGTLVRHAPSGLGIASDDGQATPFEWPFGYTVRDEAGRLALVDETSRVVARERDENSGRWRVRHAVLACLRTGNHHRAWRRIAAEFASRMDPGQSGSLAE